MRVQPARRPVALLVALTASCASQPLPPVLAAPDEVAASTIHNPRSVSLGATLSAAEIAAVLEGHGHWIETPTWGRVWLPAQQRDFVPYGTDGRWLVTDAGWYWQSALPWGALTFHYGRWVRLDAHWGWVPGSQFAPAWVDWRAGNGWVAWSARAPRGGVSSAPFVFCRAGDALDAAVWQRVLLGVPTASLFPRTSEIACARGYGGAVYSPGPSAGVTPQPAPVRMGSVGVNIPVRPRGVTVSVSGFVFAGYDVAAPPEVVPPEPEVNPAAEENVTNAAGDDRAPLRIRDEDLARPGSTRLSVVNMPADARAALFARPRPQLAVAEVSRDARPIPEALPPLPPPADMPGAWSPWAPPRRVYGRVAAQGEAFAAVRAAPIVGPSTVAIPMPAAPPPSSGTGVNLGGGFSRGAPALATVPRVVGMQTAMPLGMGGAGRSVVQR